MDDFEDDDDDDDDDGIDQRSRILDRHFNQLIVIVAVRVPALRYSTN